MKISSYLNFPYINKYCLPFVFLLNIVIFSQSIQADLLNFENGSDSAPINTSIPGVQFTTTQGFDWVYGDWRAGYNGPYPNGSYYSFGNFFAWLGPNQGEGRIDFDLDVAKRVTTRYSSFSTVKLEAFDAEGNLLAIDSGGGNLDTGVMGTLQVEAPNIAYASVDRFNGIITKIDNDLLKLSFITAYYAIELN